MALKERFKMETFKSKKMSPQIVKVHIGFKNWRNKTRSNRLLHVVLIPLNTNDIELKFPSNQVSYSVLASKTPSRDPANTFADIPPQDTTAIQDGLHPTRVLE